MQILTVSGLQKTYTTRFGGSKGPVKIYAQIYLQAPAE